MGLTGMAGCELSRGCAESVPFTTSRVETLPSWRNSTAWGCPLTMKDGVTTTL